MRIRVLDVEGSAEELAGLPELQEALLSIAGARSSVQPALLGEDTDDEDAEAESPVAVGELSKEVADFIKIRSGSKARGEVVSRWVGDVLGWGDTHAVIGTSKTTPDGLNNYLMLYANGPRRYGAFAYVLPGNARMIFRLTRDEGDGYAYATFRTVKNYEVTVTLDSDGAYDEALALAKLALAGVRA